MRSVADEGLERNLNLIPSEITKIIEFKVADTIMLARAFYVNAWYTCIIDSTAVTAKNVGELPRPLGRCQDRYVTAKAVT
jgi:hypothetical protein